MSLGSGSKNAAMTAVSLPELLSRHPLVGLAWKAAGAAAAFLHDERPDALAIDTKSSPTDAVTEMDRGAEARLIEILLGARPTDGLLGEEGGERPGTSGVRWVVDPLDGTVNYLYRIPSWAVSVAAEVGGGSEIGVVVAPALGEAYIGIRGGGAWSIEGDEAWPMAVRECGSLANALVSTGFGYCAKRRAEQAAVVLGLAPLVRDFRRAGAAVVDLCWLARGRLDGHYESGLNRWDIAAGGLIAAEAGAIVAGLRSADPNVGTFVAAVPGINEEFRAALMGAGAGTSLVLD
jgi:myo-inositol-1(or 4)-monophosphatase